MELDRTEPKSTDVLLQAVPQRKDGVGLEPVDGNSRTAPYEMDENEWLLAAEAVMAETLLSHKDRASA
jgi:hypothetical protein